MSIEISIFMIIAKEKDYAYFVLSMIDGVEQTEKQGHELGTFIVQKASTDPSAYTVNCYNNLIMVGEIGQFVMV